MTRSAAILLLVTMMAGGAASAQDVSGEFGRVSGGQLQLLTKGSAPVSGSLGLNLSGAGEGYGATFGGTLLRDRLWFFSSASTMPGTADRPVTEAADAKMTAQLGDRNSLAATFSRIESDEVRPGRASFLSLRYDGIASSNLFFSGSVSIRSMNLSR